MSTPKTMIATSPANAASHAAASANENALESAQLGKVGAFKCDA